MSELSTNPAAVIEQAAVEPAAKVEIPFDAYWRLRMDGATSRLNAVREIVTHNPTRGTFAESLLREVIAEFLPQRYAAATGFIMDRPKRSNQVDIIVYDQLTDSPVFRDGGFVILTPGTAKLVIEVKSALIGAAKESDNEIAIAFNNIRSAKQIDPNVRGFVFGYDGNQGDTLVEHVKTWGLKANKVPRTEWPDRVFNLKHGFGMVPTPGKVEDDGSLKDDSTHGIYSDKAIVRSFLTAALQAINLANVRGFLTADEVGEPSEIL
jgi:hypothetical protein